MIMVVAAAIHLLGFVLQAIGGDIRSYVLFAATFALIGFGALKRRYLAEAAQGRACKTPTRTAGLQACPTCVA